MTDWRKAARPYFERALSERDQQAFAFLLVQLLTVAKDEEIKDFATEVLADMNHDTQMWWLDDCNCDGHLN